MGSINIFSRKFFCSHSAEGIRRVNPLVFHFFWAIEKVWIKGRRLSRFSVESFLCHNAENFRRGESFSVSLFSGIEDFFASEAHVTIIEFLSKFFCLTVSKNSVGAPFNVSLISSIEIVWIRGGRVSRLFVECFLCHSAEKSRRGTLYCFIIFGQRKCLDQRGGSIKFFRRKLFVSQCRETS